MRRVAAAEAGTNFPALLDHVERGEPVLITRDGRAVARLVAEPRSPEASSLAEIVSTLRAEAAARGYGADAEEIRGWIEEGRR